MYYVPSSSGPAPVGAPYQVALAASQLGSAVKAEALKLTGGGLAHEPYETRSEGGDRDHQCTECNHFGRAGDHGLHRRLLLASY